MNRLKVAENMNLDFVGKLWENHDSDRRGEDGNVKGDAEDAMYAFRAVSLIRKAIKITLRKAIRITCLSEKRKTHFTFHIAAPQAPHPINLFFLVITAYNYRAFLINLSRQLTSTQGYWYG
jgi:hypothetical protein